MKLARPDVFHPRIVLAGDRDGDDAGLVAALRRRGLHARWLAWDDPDTLRADLVILRATRDYGERLGQFLAWTRQARNVLNAPGVVAWNADRRYLADLAARGVPTVPGAVFAPGERIRLPRAGSFFVGPAVGTGTRRFDGRPAAAAFIGERPEAVFVQPAESSAETELVFLGGEPSHAFPSEPDFELWDVGAAALAGAAAQVAIGVNELLYAKARLNGARLLELQLIDPSLGWRRLDPDTRAVAERRFAVAVESALERLGLGPFSHGRP